MNSEDSNSQDEYESINQEILKNIQISSQEHMLIKSLEKFYNNNPKNVNLMLPIIRGESNISMRLIDYFVTNYSKKHRIIYNIEENNNTIIFNVFSSYKSQLKAYNKKYFDPFSRGNRIPFFFPDDCIITTIGQLNFFKWFISKKIINYVSENLNTIEKDLNNQKKVIKKKNKKDKKKKKIINKAINLNNNIDYSNKINLNEPKKKIDIVVTFE
jgi:hypothetical protein